MTGVKVKTKYFNVISLDFFFNSFSSRADRISSEAVALRFLFPACPFHDSRGDEPSGGGWRPHLQPGTFPRVAFGWGPRGVASGPSLPGGRGGSPGSTAESGQWWSSPHSFHPR